MLGKVGGKNRSFIEVFYTHTSDTRHRPDEYMWLCQRHCHATLEVDKIQNPWVEWYVNQPMYVMDFDAIKRRARDGSIRITRVRLNG